MNAVRGFFQLFADSPTYGRDKASLFSGFTIGISALVLNAAVLSLVLPLMLDPDDSDFRMLTENLEFGQLLALILLGGASALATFLIPLRMSTVFMGPRIGSYFDQVVLSGISPFRFLIGKATSQNLFIALALFLLLPYLVLSVALGGMEPLTFLCGVTLVWLYSMMIAVLSLLLSLYFNELFSAFLVIATATFCAFVGCMPIEFQPFLVTPFPVLMNSVYTNIPMGAWYEAPDFYVLFFISVTSMLLITATGLFAIYLGPLYGILTENSTFGEVVRAGDSKKKRWFRLRPHIQRSSEIAFFYQNRDDAFRKVEGFIRWGGSLVALLALSAIAYGILYFVLADVVRSTSTSRWFGMGFQCVNLTIHGVGLFLAVLMFSHSKNNLYQRLPLFRERSCEVSTADSVCFAIFMIWSVGAALAIPAAFERFVAIPADISIFRIQRSDFDLLKFSYEGLAVITVSGVVVFMLQKLISHFTWLKSVSMLLTSALYFLVICMGPAALVILHFEFHELRQWPLFNTLAAPLSMFSPFVAFGHLSDEFGSRLPMVLSTIPFYVGHGTLFVLLWLGLRRASVRVKKQYLRLQEQQP